MSRFRRFVEYYDAQREIFASNLAESGRLNLVRKTASLGNACKSVLGRRDQL